MMQKKFLSTDDAGIEVKDGTITGYGSVFGVKDGGGDIVVKGAFSDTLKSRPNVKMLWGHDAFSPPIGVWTSVKEDQRGLMMEGELFMETERGREAHVALKSGAIDGLSIGYSVADEKRTKNARELRKLNLFEVSVVNFPMNEDATVQTVKSLSDFESPAEKKRFLEKALRDAGFSKSEATHGASVLVSDVLGRDDAKASAEMASDLRQFMRELRA